MKKILVLLLVFSQCFGQGLEIYRGNQNIFYVAKPNAKNVVDSLSFIDSRIPQSKLIIAYQDGVAYYDSAIVSFNYNSDKLWLNQTNNVEYKIAKFDSVRKEIRLTVGHCQVLNQPAIGIFGILLVTIIALLAISFSQVFTHYDYWWGTNHFILAIFQVNLALFLELLVCKCVYDWRLAMLPMSIILLLYYFLAKRNLSESRGGWLLLQIIFLITMISSIGLITNSWLAFLIFSALCIVLYIIITGSIWIIKSLCKRTRN